MFISGYAPAKEVSPMLENYLVLLYTFFKIGLFGFGGGYAMLSMIMAESARLAITFEQFADLNALDMVVPGPIAINAATYVGYLNSGFLGSVFATAGVMIPSLILVTLVLKFLDKYKKNRIMSGFLSGVKPAAVGLISAAALTIAAGVVLSPDTSFATFFADPLGSVSLLMLGIFAGTAFVNIRFKVNPILLTAIAGIIGAIWVR